MIRQNELYRRFGVVTEAHLTRPRFGELKDFEIPVGSVLHYIPETQHEFGPDQTDFYFQQKGSVYIHHLEEVTHRTGVARNVTTATSRLIRDYHRRNRKLRTLRRKSNMEQGLNDNRVLIVYNYCLLQHLVTYTRSTIASYNSWLNQSNTLWDNVKDSLDTVENNSYIHIRLPAKLPSREDLVKLSNRVNAENLDSFRTNESLDIFKIWSWLTHSQKHSENIDALGTDLDKVNLLFVNGGKFSILNLGVLSSFRGETEDSADSNNQQSRLFLRFLNNIQELQTEVSSEEEEEEEFDIVSNPHQDTLELARSEKAKVLLESGNITVPEYNRAVKIGSKFKTITMSDGRTLEQAAEVKEEDVKLVRADVPEIEGVLDKGMLNKGVRELNQQYVERVMEADILKTVLSVQKSGIAVTALKKETHRDAASHYDHYSIQLTPLTGSPSPIHIRIPKVDEDGKMLVSGVKCIMAKQRVDLPIRKVKFNRVALTTYYGKCFVDRSSAVVDDKQSWIRNKISEAALDMDDNSVTKIYRRNCYDPTKKLPLDYSAIAMGISGFTCKSGEMSFEYDAREELYGKETLRKLEKQGHVICGKFSGGFITMSPSGDYYRHTDGDKEIIGGLSALLDKPLGSTPNSVAVAVIMGKKIPVGLILAYLFGFNKTLKLLKAKYRKVSRGTKVELADNEASIVFSDETIVYRTDDVVSSLALSGWRRYRNSIRNFSLDEFESEPVYQAVLDSIGLKVRYLNEIKLMNEMFIDPISDEILKSRGEPRTFIGLLMMSLDLLKDSATPKETDAEFMRIRGYERFSGVVYQELVKSIRDFSRQPATSKAKINMNPKAVWSGIMLDATVQPSAELNPIQHLRESELVTYVGNGGRTARTMAPEAIMYHPTDVGFISEATVDSSSVGVNTYLTSNPSFDTLRTIPKPLKDTSDISSMVSTSAVCSVGALKDDPKRVNFISIQKEHTVATNGSVALPVSTGADRVMAHRVGSDFATIASGDGRVTKVTEKSLEITMGDGSVQKVELGTRIGSASGAYVPHRIITDLYEGAKVTSGSVVAWNKDHFSRDTFDPTQARMKAGALVRTAFVEGNDTLEDGCAISESLANTLATDSVTVRNIMVDFKDGVVDLVKVGESVILDTPLCTIEDALISDNEYFDEETNASLKDISNKNPKANTTGYIESIEVLYHGDISDMSKSLATIARRADKERKSLVEESGSDRSITGRVNEAINVEGTRLIPDKLLIRVNITKSLVMGVGDKGVFGNQLKTIVCRVMSGENHSESGEPIDALFGFASVAARVVNSPVEMGTLNVATKLIAQGAVAEYFGNGTN